MKKRLRSPRHLAWIRTRPCVIAGWHFCVGRTQAAHIRTGTDGGMGIKPSDKWVVPLCAMAHKEQHTIGEPAFEARYSVDLKELAARYWKLSPAYETQ